MELTSLLRACGPDIWSSKIKVMRHADERFDLEEILRSGTFSHYENRQSRPVLAKADYVLSFLGEGRTRSRFLWCRKVAGVHDGVPALPAGFLYPDMPRGRYWYDLEPVRGFEALENRVVIDWGKGTRSWVQWLKPWRVIEVYPEGHVGDFPGYDGVVMPFSDLERIVKNPDANRTWLRMLGAVAGVYLITDTRTGEQYVGSAYGEGGIAARWRSYVQTKHGGNKILIERICSAPGCHLNFQFSILRTLPLSMTPNEVIAVEGTYKRKLGSRAHGLNAN